MAGPSFLSQNVVKAGNLSYCHSDCVGVLLLLALLRQICLAAKELLLLCTTKLAQLETPIARYKVGQKAKSGSSCLRIVILSTSQSHSDGGKAHGSHIVQFCLQRVQYVEIHTKMRPILFVQFAHMRFPRNLFVSSMSSIIRQAARNLFQTETTCKS